MERCSLCPGVNRCIGPEGPESADVLFISEAPGINENKTGHVLTGRVGQEVDRHYLPLAGLRRENVCVVNAIRCLPISAGGKLDASRRQDLELLDSCASHHLYPLIERLRPKVIVTLGAFAARALQMGIVLDIQHGIPRTEDTSVGCPVFPMMHPSRGMHEPKKMLQIRTDWWRLGKFLKGTLPIRQDAYPNPDYVEVTDETELEDLDPSLPLACDTESTRKREPFCLTYSQSAGTGRLIRATRQDLLEGFNARLARWKTPILFHNWLYDWSVTLDMGLRFPSHRVVDTMAVAYHLGNLPQGLKALAYRELGMVMEDFDDLVTPFSKAMVLFYYQLCKEHPWPKPEAEMVQDDKTGLWKLYKPQGMSTKLKRFFTDYEKSPETKDVFLMWEKNWVSQQSMIEEAYGPWPGKCITHVPFEKVLYYACRDVDALIRLWPVLQGMKARVRHFSQELWRVA